MRKILSHRRLEPVYLLMYSVWCISSWNMQHLCASSLNTPVLSKREGAKNCCSMDWAHRGSTRGFLAVAKTAAAYILSSAHLCFLVILMCSILFAIHLSRSLFYITARKMDCFVILTLLLLNTTCPVLANSVDPDQLASEEANRSGSALFVIKYVNFYQKPGSSNLIGWNLEVGVAS